jgi:2-hydroxychromene-2-carboxylate isomerase
MSNAISQPTLEFWYEFASNYSYLSVMRIDSLARDFGVKVSWKPFLLGPIFKSFGWESSPFVLQKEKGAYVWQDMARQCHKYGVPWKKPSVFPRNAVLPLRVALLGAEQPWVGAFNQRVMQLNFAEDREINDGDIISTILLELGLPADQLIAQALSDSNKLALRAQTEEAQRRGIFGAPTFFAHGEMFWGNDRLEDALQFAVQRVQAN